MGRPFHDLNLHGLEVSRGQLLTYDAQPHLAAHNNWLSSILLRLSLSSKMLKSSYPTRAQRCLSQFYCSILLRLPLPTPITAKVTKTVIMLHNTPNIHATLAASAIASLEGKRTTYALIPVPFVTAQLLHQGLLKTLLNCRHEMTIIQREERTARSLPSRRVMIARTALIWRVWERGLEGIGVVAE